MAQLKRQEQSHQVSMGLGRDLSPALPSSTPVGPQLQASVLLSPLSGHTLLTTLFQGTLARILAPAGRGYNTQTREAHWCLTGSSEKPHFPEEQGKESYTTARIPSTSAARELGQVPK